MYQGKEYIFSCPKKIIRTPFLFLFGLFFISQDIELLLCVFVLQEDDEHTIDEDEAQITEAERNEELAALQAEADLPLDDILKLYTKNKGDLRKTVLFCHVSHILGINSVFHFALN